LVSYLTFNLTIKTFKRGRRGRDRIVDWSTTTCTFSVYHYYSCEFESRSWRGVLDAILCDKVCQWLTICFWFSPGSLVYSTNKTDIIEILMKVALNTITLTPTLNIFRQFKKFAVQRSKFLVQLTFNFTLMNV